MTMKEILNDFIIEPTQEKQKKFNPKEKFEKIYSQKASKEVYEYLKSHFDNLKIEILSDHKGNIMELMEKGLLESWCWQTTETAILFLDDDSYIERGNLKFDEYNSYYHSWIVFNYLEKEYVFDPCLQIICKKELYTKTFDIELKGKVIAKKVKEYFINYINNPPVKNYSKVFKDFLKEIFGEEALKRKENEVIVYDKEEPNAPMYRNGAGYKATIEKGKVKKLVAHYYYTDC